MKKNSIYIYLLILLLTSCSNNEVERPELQNGFLDLSSWDFEKNGSVNLNGEWEFYWNNFLNPKDFNKKNTLKPSYIYVPKSWAVAKNDKKKYPEFGYATYRLKIKIPDKEIDYKFKFSSIFSSVRIWINGELSVESGVIGKSKAESKPKYFIHHIVEKRISKCENDTLEIIIQVSDFYKGGNYAGIKRQITFGPSNIIYQDKSTDLSLTFSLVGILLMIALYHLFLYAYRRKELSYLMFSLISLVAAIRSLFNAGIFSESFSYDFFGRFGFMPVVLYPVFLIIFFHLLYKEEINKKVVYLFLFVASFFLPFVFVGAPDLAPKTESFLILYLISAMLYLVAYSLIKVLFKKRQGAIFAYFGTLILFASSIHDAIYSQGIINGFGFFISEIGFGIYVVLQSLNLAETFSLSFKKNITLNEILDHQNKNLEGIVKQRTSEIVQQNEEILVQNEILNQKNEEIRAQSEELEYQRDLANTQRDDIISSINYAKRIQRAVLPSKELAYKVLSEHFILFKPRNIVSGDFYWIKQVGFYTIVAAADSTGHGVPGAFMSMLGSSFLNEIVSAKSTNTSGEILNHLRDKIKESLNQKGEKGEQKDGMDIALYIINTQTFELQFSGANNPIYIIRKNELLDNLETLQSNNKVEVHSTEFFDYSIIELKPDRQPIAIFINEKKFVTQHFQIKKGDCLYTFSDGYVDQFGGEHGEKFKRKNFKNLLLSIIEKPMPEQKQILYEQFEEWKGLQEQVDDVLVMGVRII